MEALLRPGGPVRFIGISNFSPAQLEELVRAAAVKPHAHQFELHPYLPQAAFVEANRRHGIAVTGYAPLGNTSPFYKFASQENGTPPLLGHAAVAEVAAARGCSPAQVVLAWNLRRGVAVVPKAVQAGHIKENIRAEEACRLTDGDARRIDAISERTSGRMNNPCKRMRIQCFLGLDNPTQGW
jgi:alcohol dehydrogenase (NADP+)